MTIEQDIQLLSQLSHQNIVLPLPPPWETIVLRAREEGIPVGRLFAVSRPLSPGVRGSYYRATKELWCYLDLSDRAGEQQALVSLFVLIAHARLCQPKPQTINEDWEQERLVWNEAALLAHRWGWQEVFPHEVLSARRAEIDLLHLRHQAAGLLAGNTSPLVARAAYRALVELHAHRQWSEEQFTEALEDLSEDEALNAAVVDFDRSVLRSAWRITSFRGQGNPFGSLALPQTTQSARVLRRLLTRAAQEQSRPLRAIKRTWLDDLPLHLHFLPVQCEDDLVQVMASVNAWLIEEGPDLAVEGRWQMFGSRETGRETDRIYRLSVRYMASLLTEQRNAPLPAAHELWVLFHAEKRTPLLETAWQRFILSWLKMMDLTTGETLQDGIRLLWQEL